MRQKLTTFAAFCVCLLGLSHALCGQNPVPIHTIVPGYLDPVTGSFRPSLNQTSDAVPPALTTYAGKFVFNFTITVDATISSTAKIECGAQAQLLDGTNTITEQAAALATRSGSTATCTVNIPYSWNLASGTTDKVALGYGITAPVEVSPTGTSALPSRVSGQAAFAVISVPASGTTTTETLTPTI